MCVGNHCRPGLPLTLWPWEQDKSLHWIWGRYMSSRCSVSSHTVENSFSHEHPTSTKEKRGLQRKTWGREAFVQGTAANLNSATAKTITSASWKLGDNLFMLCCLSSFILLPHLDSLKTWTAGLLSFRFIISVTGKLMEGAPDTLLFFPLFPRSYTFHLNATYWEPTENRPGPNTRDWSLERAVAPHVNVCVSGICLCRCRPFPCTSPICNRLVAAHCQRADVWLLFLLQDFVWNP